MKNKFINLLLLLLLYCMSINTTAFAGVIGLSELSKYFKATSTQVNFPFVMVFKDNRLLYQDSLHSNYLESDKSIISKEMIDVWVDSESTMRYRISLDELIVFFPSIKDDLSKLTKADANIKIIHVGVWYQALQNNEKFILKRDNYLHTFKEYEKSHGNVKILNVDFDPPK
ncbi:MAG: hypothetical protein L3J53_05060 [Proteobacteria bacterium]|nr:hypothetical protein [Pseudomonadota bacterium]